MMSERLRPRGRARGSQCSSLPQKQYVNNYKSTKIAPGKLKTMVKSSRNPIELKTQGWLHRKMQEASYLHHHLPKSKQLGTRGDPLGEISPRREKEVMNISSICYQGSHSLNQLIELPRAHTDVSPPGPPGTRAAAAL